jgi:hypothetical protein
VAFRAHLPHPQLSKDLVDLRGQFARQVRARVLVHHRSHVDQQPGISPAQLHLGGVEQAEQELAENLIDRKRPQPPRILASVLGRPFLSRLGVTGPSSTHDSTPPYQLAAGRHVTRTSPHTAPMAGRRWGEPG